MKTFSKLTYLKGKESEVNNLIGKIAVFYAEDTETLFLLDTKEAIKLELDKGDQGDTGPEGPQGDTGDTGLKGDSGSDGFGTELQYNDIISRLEALEAI